MSEKYNLNRILSLMEKVKEDTDNVKVQLAIGRAIMDINEAIEHLEV